MRLRRPMSRRNEIKLEMEGEWLLRAVRRSFGILCMCRDFARWGLRKMWSTDREGRHCNEGREKVKM